MKILRVKLTNLNSLRGQHEVDFQAAPLTGVGLFAITGPTGAGKSTLLDAITLALYGKAARYGATPSPEDMMSRHCGECAAEVEFQVPSGTYRAEWQLHRARGKASGKVQAAKRYVYDAAGQPMAQNVRDTEELIEKLIGLDYARFLRSALLAQGDFAQFLKARPDERAELLESLTGTSIYSELGTLAHTETVRRENELRTKEAGIQNIPLLEEQQRLKLAADIPAAETTFSQVKQDLQQANDLLNKATNLATALEQERTALEKQQSLTTERKTAEKDLQRLSHHRLTIPFHGDLAKLDAAEQAVSTSRSLLEQAQGEHIGAVRNAKRCLRGLRRMIDEQIEQIKSGEQKILAAVERKTNAEKWLKQHKSDKDLPDGLADLISELAGLKGARKDLGREWGQIRKLAVKLDRNEADELPQSADDPGKAKAKQLLTRLAELAEKKQAVAAAARKKADAELKLREDHLKKAQLVASLEQHRDSLKKGEPCPLCGSKDHPFADGDEPSFPFKDLERRVTEAKEACRTREKHCDELEQLQGELQENGKSLLSVVGECSEVLELLTRKLSEFALTVPALGAEDETKSTMQQRASAYSKQATEAENAGRDRTDADGDLKRLKSGLTTLDDKQSTLANESLTEPTQKEDAESETNEVLPRWSSIAAADRDWSTAKGNLTAANTTLGNRLKDKKLRETELADALSGLSSKLSGSAFTGIDNLKAARLDNADALRIESVDNRLKGDDQKIKGVLQAARESIEKWRQEAAPEGEKVNELKEQQKALQSQHNQLIQDLTTWRNQISQDEKNRGIIAAKQKELEADRQRLVVWQRLRGLIGSHDGRTFRRYAQSVSLDVLVYYANRQLLRLNDRYQLLRREGDELDLEIEDLHQAGAVRPMASLSGGESFLASLALALGLSDIAGRKVRIESLFIDEGFGSLDSDTLDVAISALETLRQDNKTVGVISHVDLLKERIATQIIVEKQSGGTSCFRIAS